MLRAASDGGNSNKVNDAMDPSVRLFRATVVGDWTPVSQASPAHLRRRTALTMCGPLSEISPRKPTEAPPLKTKHRPVEPESRCLTRMISLERVGI